MLLQTFTVITLVALSALAAPFPASIRHDEPELKDTEVKLQHDNKLSQSSQGRRFTKRGPPQEHSHQSIVASIQQAASGSGNTQAASISAPKKKVFKAGNMGKTVKTGKAGKAASRGGQPKGGKRKGGK